MSKQSKKNLWQFIDQKQSSSQHLEMELSTLYGTNSMAIKAFDLVREEMCSKKGFKRDNGTDYYTHCVDVANTLISFEIKDEDVVCAALLHDIIEDVKGYSEITIAKMFNPNVARLVMLVTKKEGVNYKQTEAIRRYLQTIAADMNAAAIKTADRMHNMMTLEEKTFDARYRKAMETETFYLPFFKKCMQLYPRYVNLFYNATAEIEQLVFHIKSFYNENQRLERENEQLKKQLQELQKMQKNA